MAHLPFVVWIGEVKPAFPRDEKQTLIMLGKTNVLNGGISASDRYIHVLTNDFGFSQDSSQYPIVDIADGLIALRPNGVIPDLFELGDTNNASRLRSIVTYPVEQYQIRDKHANAVASIMAGYSVCENVFTNVDTIDRTHSFNAVVCLNEDPEFPGFDCDVATTANRYVGPICAVVPEGFVVCNNFDISTDQSQPTRVLTNLTLRYFTTNSITVVNTQGYQVRMGVSPFGRFSNNAIIDADRKSTRLNSSHSSVSRMPSSA